MLKLLFLAIPAVIVVTLLIAAFKPSEFTISRSTVINAPPSVIFPLVNDLREWQAWSPWEKLDPNMKKTFEGPSAGEGASMSWTAGPKVGSGRNTIVKAQSPERIDMRLDMIEPMKATHDVAFTFQPETAGTRVTWSMSGHSGLMSRVFCLFMNMDKMVGEPFEKGLADLKVLAESKVPVQR
jgi:uncharacterized protein YndB with AHSA1/START domain